MPRDASCGAGAAVVAALVLAGCGPAAEQPLWPGSKYTEAARSKALMRALEFIDRSANNLANFHDSGSDYLYCFSSMPERRAIRL
jgi:hypothetical protein